MTDSLLLTEENVPAYVSERSDALQNIFPADATLTAKEIQGGNLNYAFQVTDGNKSVFVKQAPDFIKVFGPEVSSNHLVKQKQRSFIQQGAHRYSKTRHPDLILV